MKRILSKLRIKWILLLFAIVFAVSFNVAPAPLPFMGINIAYAATSVNSPSSNTGAGWTSPTNAYADGTNAATITSGAPSGNNIWGTYGFSLTGQVITGVRIRADAWQTIKTVTPSFISGAETGIVSESTGNLPAYWYLIGGTPAVVTSPVRSGNYAYYFDANAATNYLQKDTGTTNKVIVMRAAIRFGVLPDGDVTVIGFVNAKGYTRLRFIDTGGAHQLQLQVNTGTTSTYTPAIVINTWYLIGIEVDSTGTTTYGDWQVDGVSQAQSSYAQATSVNTYFYIGIASAVTADMYVDDIMISYTAADYPLGDGKILGFSPNISGTHSFTLGDFKDTAGTNIAVADTTVAHALVDEVPITSNADYIQQAVIRADGYVEIGFADTTETVNGRCLQVATSQHSSAAQADKAAMNLNDGGTIAEIYALTDVSETTLFYGYKSFTTAPSGGAWTPAKINAIKVRWGYSTDISPVPYLDGAMIEVEFPIVDETISTLASWDGGSNWSSASSDTVTGTEITYWHDVTAATAWTPAKLVDGQLQVKAYATTVGQPSTVNLDWLAVEVTYSTVSISDSPQLMSFGVLDINTTSTTTINYFTITNTGELAVDITMSCTNFTGGGKTWNLSDTATPAENVWGLQIGLDDADDNFDITIKNAPITIVTNLLTAHTQSWGMKIYMPTTTTDYTGQEMSATATLIATQHT